MRAKPAWRGAEFWHSAASLQFQDRHRDQIDRTNIAGTEHALQLAARADVRCFNMISTAYVAGLRGGFIPAGPAQPGHENNHYERSKVQAEARVVGSGLRHRILRPGVVIGHSTTKHSMSDDGFYGLIRNLIKYHRVLNRTEEGLGDRHVASLVAQPAGGVDLVPVDWVAGEAVGLSIADAAEGYFHLTNPEPPIVGDSLTACFVSAGFPPPEFVDTPDDLDDIDRKLYERMTFYNSYMVNPKVFDRESVRSTLGESVRSTLGESVRSTLGESVRSTFGESVRSTLGQTAPLPPLDYFALLEFGRVYAEQYRMSRAVSVPQR